VHTSMSRTRRRETEGRRGVGETLLNERLPTLSRAEEAKLAPSLAVQEPLKDTAPTEAGGCTMEAGQEAILEILDQTWRDNPMCRQKGGTMKNLSESASR
jgi:hypothetical protein